MGRKIYKNKDEHFSIIMENLKKLRNNEEHCDLTIDIDGIPIHAHKNILAACSKYFREVFKLVSFIRDTEQLNMDYTGDECLKCCIDYMYTAEIDIPDGKCSELLEISERLKLVDVTDAVRFYQDFKSHWSEVGTKSCLDKRQHNRKIMTACNEMRESRNYCDFLISAGDMRLYTHRNILISGSNYFRAMLSSGMQESLSGKVDMKGIDLECLKICIDFIYTAEIEIPDRDGMTFDLLSVSQFLQLDEITKAVSEEIKRGLTVENYLSTRQIAELYEAENLLDICEEFEQKYFTAISFQPAFQNSDKCYLLEIFRSCESLMLEEEKLQVCVNWVRGRTSRKTDFIEFLKDIDLKEVPAPFLKNLINNDCLICNDFELRKIFFSALEDISRKCDKKAAEWKDNELRTREDEKNLLLFNEDEDLLDIFDAANEEFVMTLEVQFENFSYFTPIVINSRVYIFCQDKSVYRLDAKVEDASWEKVQDMKFDHGYFPPVASALGSVFVIGSGCRLNPCELTMSKTIPSSVERFDPEDDRWIKMRDRPPAITNSALVSIERSIYCIGGWTGKSESNSFWKFDTLSSNWLELPPLSDPKVNCRAVALNGRIMVFGGWRNWVNIDEIVSFDINTSQWSIMPPMGEYFIDIRVCVTHDSIFVGGRGNDLDAMLRYDLKSEEWEPMYEFPPITLYDFVSI